MSTEHKTVEAKVGRLRRYFRFNSIRKDAEDNIQRPQLSETTDFWETVLEAKDEYWKTVLQAKQEFWERKRFK